MTPAPSDERLGLEVSPDKIRLHPSRDSGYEWSVADSQQYLFEKELSNGNIGIYRSLMEELGHSIEAIRPQIAGSNGDQRMIPIRQNPETGSDSFTATIERLKSSNQKFALELNQARAELQRLSQQKEEWDSKTRNLQEQLVSSQSRADRLERELFKAKGDIAGAIDILQNQQSENPTPRKRMRNM